jgi:hypothetical protein
MAFRVLHWHEYFHFLTDLAAATLELATGRPLYVNYADWANSGTPSWNVLEEGMGNAFALNTLRRFGMNPDIRQFMERQPAGYRDFSRYFTHVEMVEGKRRLIHQLLHPHSDEYAELVIHGLTGWPVQFVPGDLLLDTKQVAANPGEVPLFIIRSLRRSLSEGTWRFIQAVQAVIESKRFVGDFQRLPDDVRRKWGKAKSLMQANVWHRSLKFEKLRGHDTVFSVRIDRSHRATLRPVSDGQWEALRIAKHEALYRNPV